MSEIASKANSTPSSSLAQPLVKKGGDATQEILFAVLFGGVAAAETGADLTVGGLGPVDADADNDADPNGKSDILASMQAVVAMMSGQHSKSRSGGSEADAASQEDAVLVDEDELASLNAEPSEDTTPVNPIMIGPLPLQRQIGTSLPAAVTSTVMAQMAFEDGAVMPHQQKGVAAQSIPIPATHQTGPQTQIAALSLPSLQTMKSAEKSQSTADSIDNMLTGELDIETSQLRSDRRRVIKPTTYQQNISQASVANSKSVDGSDQPLIDMAKDVQFDSPDDFMRTVSGQIERSFGRISSKSVFGDNLSANAVRQMQAAGVSVGGQMSQQNNGQTGGQSGGLISASAGMTNSSIMDMLDMAQDNWTEMLLQRVERGLAGGKDKIDFHLNPRNLGKLRVSLIVQNDRTNVYIQTETGAAAQMLSDAEARLAQMMDASGLKFGNLTSQHSQNFAGQNSGQGRDRSSSNASASGGADATDETDVGISVEQPENLINMQA